MTPTKEKELIREALSANNPQERTDKRAREILIERLRNCKEMNDRHVRIALEELVDKMHFPLYYRIVEEPSPVPIQKKNGLEGMIWYITCTVVGFLFVLFSPLWTRLIGIAILIITAIAFWWKTCNQQPTPPAKNTALEPSTSVDDIIAMVDALYKSMRPLIELNQIDGRYSYVLKWAQERHGRTPIDKREPYEELLEQLNYEFVPFEDSLADFFEIVQANINQITTTSYAVRNRKTGKFMRNGIVAFPKDETEPADLSEQTNQ